MPFNQCAMGQGSDSATLQVCLLTNVMHLAHTLQCSMCSVQCLMCKVQRSKWEGSNAGAQAGDSARTLMCLQSKGGPGARYVFYYALLSPLKIYPPCSIRIHSVADGNANVNSTLLQILNAVASPKIDPCCWVSRSYGIPMVLELLMKGLENGFFLHHFQGVLSKDLKGHSGLTLSVRPALGSSGRRLWRPEWS